MATAQSPSVPSVSTADETSRCSAERSRRLRALLAAAGLVVAAAALVVGTAFVALFVALSGGLYTPNDGGAILVLVIGGAAVVATLYKVGAILSREYRRWWVWPLLILPTAALIFVTVDGVVN